MTKLHIYITYFLAVPQPCDPNPCLNGGVCVPGFGAEFTCECKDGYVGRLCHAGKYNLLNLLNFLELLNVIMVACND